MTRPSPETYGPAIALLSIGFAAGLYVGTARVQGELNLLRSQLADHEKLPIHPGAVSSEVVKSLERRVLALEGQGRQTGKE